MIHISKDQFVALCGALKPEDVVLVVYAAFTDYERKIRFDPDKPGDLNAALTVRGDKYERVQCVRIVTTSSDLRFDIGEGLTSDDVKKLLPTAQKVLALA